MNRKMLRYPINQYYLCKTGTPKVFLPVLWPAFPIFQSYRYVLELVLCRFVPVLQHLTQKEDGIPSQRFPTVFGVLGLGSRDKHKTQRLCNKKVDEFKHFLESYIM